MVDSVKSNFACWYITEQTSPCHQNEINFYQATLSSMKKWPSKRGLLRSTVWQHFTISVVREGWLLLRSTMWQHFNISVVRDWWLLLGSTVWQHFTISVVREGWLLLSSSVAECYYLGGKRGVAALEK